MNKNDKELSQEEILRKLIAKIQNENEEYTKNLYSMPPEKIIKHSYETTYKNEIVLFFENSEPNDFLSKKELYNLYNISNTLDAIYDKWLSYDANPDEWIFNCIQIVAKK